MQKNNPIFLNTRLKSWIKPLYTLFVVAIPSLFIWLFLGKDFRDNPPLALEYNILIALLFIVVILIITAFLIHFNILKASIMNFVFPIVICFMVIFLTSWLNVDLQWLRILIIIPCVFVVIPTNILVNKYETKKIIRQKIRTKLKEQN